MNFIVGARGHMKNIAACFRQLQLLCVLDVLTIQEPCRNFLGRVILVLYSWQRFVLRLVANVDRAISLVGDDGRVLEGHVLVIWDNAVHILSVACLVIAFEVSS